MVLREYDEAAHIENEKKISFEDGYRDAEQRIFQVMIHDDLKNGMVKEDIVKKLIKQYGISPEKIEEYFSKIDEI